LRKIAEIKLKKNNTFISFESNNMFTHLKFVFCGIPVLEVKHLGEIVKENGGEVVYTINEKVQILLSFFSKELMNQEIFI
jgi:hypothetical protein